jgi:GNAT superfamily N-acetyltransferase
MGVLIQLVAGHGPRAHGASRMMVSHTVSPLFDPAGGTEDGGPNMTATDRSPGFEIHPARADELDAISAAFPDRPRSLHEERFLQQEDGHGPYLIAWLGSEAVGHIQLQLPDERDLDAMLEGRGAAWAEDLWVNAPARGRWIGPALMRTMEREARRAGVERLVFFAGIGPHFAAARAIYRWMRWHERPEPFIESATLQRDDGGLDVYVEVVTMWEKDLTSPPPGRSRRVPFTGRTS